jgi:hypothetical protein
LRAVARSADRIAPFYPAIRQPGPRPSASLRTQKKPATILAGAEMALDISGAKAMTYFVAGLE